jgi:hypothetical protein
MIERRPRPIDVYHDECMARAAAEAEQARANDPVEEHRLALSEALGLDMGAPWDAIQERATELAAAVSAVRPPATDRTALRQRVAAALVRYDWNAGLSGRVTPSEHHYGEADAVLAVLPDPADRAAVDAVRELHQPMERGPFTICAHCSGWDGEWRCLGVVTNYPCPTLRAMAEPPADDAEHVGGGANAEDCPACSGTNPPYPFICPGPAASAVGGAQPKEA